MAGMTWQQAKHEENKQLRALAASCRLRAKGSFDPNEKLMMTTVAMAWDTQALVGETILKMSNAAEPVQTGIQIIAPPVDNAHVAPGCERFSENNTIQVGDSK